MPRAYGVRAVLVIWLAGIASPAYAAQRSPDIPPPTPVPPFGSPSPYPTVLVTPPPSPEEPRVEAAAAALADLDSGRVLFESGSHARRPIASLTKVMTALLVIERTRPTETVAVSPDAAAQTGAELGLVPGEERTVRELLLALLLQSANDAAVALAEHVSGSVDRFVAEMNARAGDLGMEDTEFRSPTGLDDEGRSTARDLLTLASEAFLNATFAGIVSTRFAKVPSDTGEPRRLQNRNALLWLYDGAFGGKTGYTAAAGFCLVAAAERDGLRLAAVVLGAPEQAFDASAELLNHGFAAWERETIVTLGGETETLMVEGKAVPTKAVSTLSVLIPRGSVIETEVASDAGLSLPVDAGDPIGSLVATSDGRVVGEVALVAARAAQARQPAAGDAGGSLWEQVWSTLSRFYGRVYEVFGG